MGAFRRKAEHSCKEASWRCCAKRKPSLLPPVGFRSPAELPGIKKAGQFAIKQVHLFFCKLPCFFLCAKRTGRAALPRRPGAGLSDKVSLCVCRFYGDKRSPFWFSFGLRKRTPPFVPPPPNSGLSIRRSRWGVYARMMVILSSSSSSSASAMAQPPCLSLPTTTHTA